MSPAKRMRRGRPPIVRGMPFIAPGDRAARMTISKIPQRRLLKSPPRRTKGAAHPFVILLKEWSPMVYAFSTEELSHPREGRDSGVNRLIDEWQIFTGSKRQPSGRELAAYLIERAFEGAWQVWGISPPTLDSDNFRRRYILGQREALQSYRKIVRESRPWPRDHRGNLLRDIFLAAKGEATERYDLQKKVEPEVIFITLLTE